MKNLKLDEIKAPDNYFELEEQEKIDVCVGILETMYEMILRMTNPNHTDKVELMRQILEATLTHHEMIEEFEVCQVLYDTQKLLNEHKSK